MTRYLPSLIDLLKLHSYYFPGELKGGHTPIALTIKEEGELTAYAIDMATRGNPLTRKDIKFLAFSIDQMHPSPTFNPATGPTDGWMTSFLGRHNDLSLRRPAIVDGGRVTMARRSVVDKYFEGVATLYTKLSNITPRRIYNLDETGFSREPK